MRRIWDWYQRQSLTAQLWAAVLLATPVILII